MCAATRKPLFDVLLLGLSAVSAGEVVLATRALLGKEATINRAYFSEAVGTEDPEEALPLWLACLESGDSMAHFALGYTLYELGRYPEAYRHLRHYTEIAPHGTWPWCWYGKGAEALGEKGEAIAAYERALELEADDGEETDATELLKALVGLEGMIGIRQRLNEQTEGKVGLHSSAEHYSDGPVAKVILSHQYDGEAPLECPACEWAGRGSEGDVNRFGQLFDVCCPSCDKMLLVVESATPDEGQEAQPMPDRPEWAPGERFSDAVAHAVGKPARQLRKGSENPYIAHLLGVCGLVIEDGGSEDEAIRRAAPRRRRGPGRQGDPRRDRRPFWSRRAPHRGRVL